MNPRGIIPKAMEENTQSITFRNGPLFTLPPYDMMQTGLLCRTSQWRNQSMPICRKEAVCAPKGQLTK